MFEAELQGLHGKERKKKYMELYCLIGKQKEADRRSYYKNLEYSRERNREKARKHNKISAELKKASDKKYAERNRDKLKKYQREYYLKNKEKLLEDSKEYYKNNYKKQYEYRKSKLKNNAGFRIACNLRSRIRQAIMNQNANKANKTVALLGCSTLYLKTYLELLFLPGMSWENYGEWHIDHIKPCASFDLTKKEEQLMCFHYTNLQPLWALDNISKGAKYE
jgi:hypothetical protein